MMCVLFAGSAALGDWDLDDPHKMHHPQLPDPNGWDINFVSPKVLADDWMCTQTGPVKDIHFWMSGRFNADPGDPNNGIISIHASIHLDIPADADAGILYSRPGEQKWEGDFDPTQFRIADWPGGQQGWFDPNVGEWVPYTVGDHENIYQVNITDIFQPFTQTEGEIYWLDLTVKTIEDDGATPMFGWKTADLNRYPDPWTGEHRFDDAVWGDMPAAGGDDIVWRELIGPDGQSLDLAFVITPEPATMSLLVLGGIAALSRRRRR